MITDSQIILYFGFNSFIEHKRGVENVIAFQSEACSDITKYYVYFGKKNEITRWKNLICISIKMNLLRFLLLNIIIWKLSKKYHRIIIHSHNYLMSFFLLKRINIMTVHDALYYQAKCLNRSFAFIFKFIEISVYKKTNLIHFVSEYAKSRSLIKSNTNSIIIPNTSHLESDIERIFTDNSSKNADHKAYVFSVRSIEDRAGIGLLIDIAEKYRFRDDSLMFLVAGKGPLLEFYRTLIKSRGLKNIIMLGYVSDDEIVSYYRQCEVVLNIALYAEGFGLPIIEGYLFNKPVIASNVCAIPEVIIDKSFLFENEADEIITKINFALNHINMDYRKFYFEKFSNQKIISEFSRMYNSYPTK